MPDIAISTREDMAQPGAWSRLATRWRALEAQAECSFFQSWSWVGCRSDERFPDPVLVEARDGGETVALALFNRRRALLGDTLHLNETGDATHDSPYVEHNAPLLRRGAEAALLPCLAAALRGFGRRLVLSGIPDHAAAAARRLPGCATARQPSRLAPYVDLATLRATGTPYESSLSANTRQQLRRSARRYGPLYATRAADIPQGLAFLDALAALHQAYWRGRGQPGAFADPFFADFHRDLIRTALPRGEVELWHVHSDTETLGYLYNFRFAGQICAYQSGFAYPTGDSHRKPGLTAHSELIGRALAEGLDGYDFLGGGDRYKTSLGKAARTLHWLELGPCWRPAALRAAVGKHIARTA